MNQVQMVPSVIGTYHARVLHLYEALFMPVLLYSSKKIIWREKESSKIRPLQMDTLKGLLGISRTDRVPNTQIRELHEENG